MRKIDCGGFVVRVSPRGPRTDPSEKIAAQQMQFSQEQAETMRKLLGLFETYRAEGRELMQPAIDFNKALASGSPEARLTAAAPIVGDITSSYKGARENIFSSLAPGAARDVAVADLERGRATETSRALASPFLSSFDKLAEMGGALSGLSLQNLGASLRAGEGSSMSLYGAGQTRNAIMQAQAARQQALLGMFGDIAQGAGSVLGGFFRK